MGNRIDRASFFAGIAAYADLGIDQMLADQGHRFGSVHGKACSMGSGVVEGGWRVGFAHPTGLLAQGGRSPRVPLHHHLS
jgi:hypothetical protein